HNIDHHNGKAEVGIFIGEKDLWDKGLGQDALRTLVDYLFQQLNLHRVDLGVYADNARGIHAYEKVGFIHEGRWRQAGFRNGHYRDLLWMSVLRDEWRGQAAR
ncbi:MAG: GNAT family N-acetyltransferase, partial [Anaerolineae bacterium]|nr:GNAT family N-acetyltransferase [Anaerolineae bacterium]